MHKPVLSIAMADDHGMVRKGMASLLQEMGFLVVMEGENGRHLIDKLDQATEMPDLCILDINMPVMNGIAAAKEIKQKWPNLPILGFSLSINESEIKHMLHNGADAYISKDCDPDDLERILRKLHAERKHGIVANIDNGTNQQHQQQA